MDFESQSGSPAEAARHTLGINFCLSLSLATLHCRPINSLIDQHHATASQTETWTSSSLNFATVMPASLRQLAELQKKIWGGSLPLQIRLASSDCRTYDESDSYLVQPSRLSYLAFLLPQLHAFFQPNLINPDVPSQDAWLSFEGVPLKWHYPLGLLYDLFSGAEPIDFDRHRRDDLVTSQATVEAASGTTPLPWCLVIHFTDYPGDQLIQLDAEGKALLDSYINTVKEADYIRNGTGRTVMSLSKEDSDNLWLAVRTRK